MPASAPFPKSVTQSRLEAHDQQFHNVLDILAKSKETGAASIASVYESLGELRFEVEAVESRERDTRLLGERNGDICKDLGGRLKGVEEAYGDLQKVLTDELERIRNDHGVMIQVRREE